ncbi:MAG: MFS transporter [Oscillospiraceae bacterium]|nr:MFS transporter [Oscillospiraceae bacterium]
MTKERSKRALMLTILLIAVFQMPQFAILPGTNLIATEIFPERTLQTIQAIMTMPGIIAVFAGVTAAMMVRYGLASKKFMTLFGFSLIALTGVVALLLNTQFWQFCLMNILIGAGMGIFVPSAQSIMFDNFDEKTRQFIMGVQFSCINGGGLIMSLLCGWLTTIVWYGGHLQMLIAIPVIIISFLILPKDIKMRSTAERSVTRTKLPASAYYFTSLIAIFMVLYNVATVNISTHLAQSNIGDSSTAGIATALLMGGGVVCGLIFPKMSEIIRDQVFTVTFIVMAIGFTLMNLFPSSLPVTYIAMFLCGSTMSMLVPRCIFNVSNLSDPSNSATATMLVCCVAPGIGHFLSPIIMTNLTMALGGESTRFRFQFTAFVCLAFAVIMFIYNALATRNTKKQEDNFNR